ncbi:MAG: hypothetical protein ACRCWB_11870 [Enterovibrio sp.]
MTTENLAFRALAAITAGFFWLAIMRFLSSYDEQVAAQERTDKNLMQLQQSHAEWITTHESQLEMLHRRIRAVERRLDIDYSQRIADEVEV